MAVSDVPPQRKCRRTAETATNSVTAGTDFVRAAWRFFAWLNYFYFYFYFYFCCSSSFAD